MLKTFLVAPILFILSLSSAYAGFFTADKFLPCGEAKIESREFFWEKLATATGKVGFGTGKGVVCLGFDRETNILKELVYRDGFKVQKKFQASSLIGNRKILVDGKDYKVPVLTNEPIMSVEIQDIKNGNYTFSFRFRTSLRGKKSETRSLRILFVPGKRNSHSIYLDSAKRMFMDEILIALTLTLKVKYVEVKNYGKVVKEIDVNELRRASSL